MNQCYSPQVIIAGRGYLFPLKSECKVTLIMWGDYQHSRWSLGHSSREVVYIAMQISCDADEDEVLIISEVCCGLLAAFCWRLHCWSHLAPQKRRQNIANFLRWGEYDTPHCTVIFLSKHALVFFWSTKRRQKFQWWNEDVQLSRKQFFSNIPNYFPQNIPNHFSQIIRKYFVQNITKYFS